MTRLEFTPRTRRDIEEIWEYSFDQFGLDKADAYLRDLQRAAMTVTDDPRRGLACDEIRSGYRKFSGRLSYLLLQSVGDPRRDCPNSPSADGLRPAYPLTS